jgi:hypothetical protein
MIFWSSYAKNIVNVQLLKKKFVKRLDAQGFVERCLSNFAKNHYLDQEFS